MKLYELTQNYVSVLDMAEEMDFDILKDTLESIQDAIEDKAENVAKLIKCLASDAVIIQEEEKRLADRRKAIDNKIINLKEYLQNQMEVAGIDKVKRPTLTVAIQNNPPSVLVKDESLIPSHYMIPVAPKLDKKSILSFIKEGGEVPGCEIQQLRGLRIK